MLDRNAGTGAGDQIAAAIRAQWPGGIVFAMSASQFATLDTLVARGDIDWSRAETIHSDECVGVSASHRGIFRHCLERCFGHHVHLVTERDG